MNFFKSQNGDTPLHISCAMSHRKLTRILLESGSKTEMVNNQGERPIDISRRKNYDSITSLLQSPPPVHSLFNRDFMRESKRDLGGGGGGSGGAGGGSREDHSNPVGWSPYGCHYHPDTCFQSKEELKVENLPTEPLQNGELYYIDLGGNIRKVIRSLSLYLVIWLRFLLHTRARFQFSYDFFFPLQLNRWFLRYPLKCKDDYDEVGPVLFNNVPGISESWKLMPCIDFSCLCRAQWGNMGGASALKNGVLLNWKN